MSRRQQQNKLRTRGRRVIVCLLRGVRCNNKRGLWTIRRSELCALWKLRGLRHRVQGRCQHWYQHRLRDGLHGPRCNKLLIFRRQRPSAVCAQTRDQFQTSLWVFPSLVSCWRYGSLTMSSSSIVVVVILSALYFGSGRNVCWERASRSAMPRTTSSMIQTSIPFFTMVVMVDLVIPPPPPSPPFQNASVTGLT